MSSRPDKKKACSAARNTRNRPYDSRPRSGPGRAERRTAQGANALRVVMPDQPPTLNPEAARVLLRILLKAHDRLNSSDNPHGGGAE